MRIRHSGRDIKSWIGDPVNTGFAVIVGNIFQQPINGVVGVRALVHILGTFFCVFVRRHFDKSTVALKSPTHILINKNETIGYKARSRSEVLRIIVCSIGSNAVRRTFDEKGIRFCWRSTLRDINRGEKLRAIPHGNTKFELRVRGTNGGNGFRVLLGLLRISAVRAAAQKDFQNSEHRRKTPPAPPHIHHFSAPKKVKYAKEIAFGTIPPAILGVNALPKASSFKGGAERIMKLFGSKNTLDLAGPRR